ncbi:hypothetical protein M405DRAFT_407989 [Rhizopogon salebrosus TDB-379]|nr:hypothetical protein M405DRAFT_407989 [Rhizopogon salebrosus TDB-379]
MPYISYMRVNATAPGSLQWLSIINNGVGLLLIFGTVYLLLIFLWPHISRVLSYVPQPGNHRSTLTESATSHSSPDLSRVAGPGLPHTTISTLPRNSNRVTPPSRNPPRPEKSRSRPHADDLIGRV